MTKVVKVMKIDYSEKVIYTIVRTVVTERVPEGRRATIPERVLSMAGVRESLPRDLPYTLPLAA